MSLTNFEQNKSSPKILFITGAGISVDSGIPTFRAQDAIWQKFDVDKVCNILNFQKNYNLAHEFYNISRNFIKDKKPNKAHFFITDLQKQLGSHRVAVATTNVDLLHEMSGLENTLHLHGKIDEMIIHWKKSNESCINIGYEQWDFLNQDISKPNIVFFNESSFYQNNIKKFIYSDLAWTLYNMNDKDIIFIIGSSNQVLNIKDIFPFIKSKIYNINPISYKNNYGQNIFDKEILKTANEAIPDIQQIINSII